jgi:hypothetical protein
MVVSFTSTISNIVDTSVHYVAWGLKSGNDLGLCWLIYWSNVRTATVQTHPIGIEGATHFSG